MSSRQVGIQAMNFYGGSAYVDVADLARRRNLAMDRFHNLLMDQKTVALPYEDPITFAVNAAKPLVDALTPAERDRIELVVTCTESGVDFGKSLSTYVHDLLGLGRNCRLCEVKNACYSGTAGFQLASSFVLANASPGALALVIATDVAKFLVAEGSDALSEDWSFAEPSGGAGAMAMLVSAEPTVFAADIGANGYYGHEVMDTCRPFPDGEAGDADTSLLSYLDCCAAAFEEYRKRVDSADWVGSFDYLSFHTPFGGMVKGAHRAMARKVGKLRGAAIEQDFAARVQPGLAYCRRVGNVMGATVFLNLFSTIANGDFDSAKRVGCFSYGSGCCSEFYSGVVTPEGQRAVRAMGVAESLDSRVELEWELYERLLADAGGIRFGTRDVVVDRDEYAKPYASVEGTGQVVLKAIKDYHREYEWV
ncbi:hydroxymethylglutaryl-CoA synthase family protein [Amycolatopsis anabasis]|uniref:hydroxymethylglutaryl-CoA synthase family protein n=1 Tax=Amycolatopsis anabasis TaxID=1840409 RepID=UPI00248370EA|nr:hydroxymethylglutaryl-CoA synthase [Amycolatopsis anabasis]